MSNLPTPLRAALGLAVTAVDEARKLPETLPQLPVVAISTAMQASLRVQQHLATLAARGDEVLSQLRGSSEEPPAWATFDDPPTGEAASKGSGQGGNGRSSGAAFDRTPAPAAELAADAESDQAADLDQPADLDRPADLNQPAEPSPAVPKARKAASKKAALAKASAPKATKKAASKTAAKAATKSQPANPATVAAQIAQAQQAESRSAE